MKKNLVIVESPAKAKTIEKFLGEEYRVQSSYGHIRDLKKKSFSINAETLEPEYEIPADKQRVVQTLKKLADEAETVWLASDEDREGEAISWHLKEVLDLKDKNTKRIVFHEITKTAILEAIKHPRKIDTNLVYAQQARRVLDRIVGFKLSPVLWRKVKPALSAGRVQSVAVRLIVEKEREVQNFKQESSFRVIGVFKTKDGSEVKGELNTRFATEEEATAFLVRCKSCTYTIEDIQKKPTKRTPAPPFTTSTLQQEAAHKLGMTVAQTMMVAQRLYESGLITYMRTDSVNLSKLCIGASKQYITDEMGEDYVKTRQFQTSTKGAQEAHEAIRPTYMDRTTIEGNNQERRLYDLIWKRTIASQMADAEMERTTVTIAMNGAEEKFVAQGEVLKFDGFLRVYKYNESDNDSDGENEDENLLPPMRKGMGLLNLEVTATQRYSQGPQRYNEASLVKKLEELGIGRPSTYATTIVTIQQREYVQRGDKKGENHPYVVLSLKEDSIKRSEKSVTLGAERGKLLPTDIGTVVNDFLMDNFPEILDYNFTADVEKQFDEVAEGKMAWNDMIHAFYDEFNPLVDRSLKVFTEHKVGERIIGNDPRTGEPVAVKIGRYGPVVQIGSAESTKKPRFAQLPKNKTIEGITLDEALELFRLPRELGEYEGKKIVIGAGRFGPYINHGGQYYSLGKEIDPITIIQDEAITIIQKYREEESKRHLRSFEEEPELEIMNGRYGPYIAYKGTNYRLTKAQAAQALTLTLEDCMEIINKSPLNKKQQEQ